VETPEQIGSRLEDVPNRGACSRSKKAARRSRLYALRYPVASLPYFFPFLAAFLAAFFFVDLGLAVETAEDFDFLPKMFSQFFENSGLAPERTIGPLIALSSFPKTTT
jgi:hypothetical protein